MSQYNKTKGATFETDVLKWLRKVGVLAERLTKAGSKDEGDMVAVIAGKTYILELKNRATLSLPQFWREAQVEALNYAKARGLGEVPLHYVVVKRRNASIDQAWVISRPSTMDKGEAMIVPGPKLIELTIVTNAGKKLYQLAEEKGWPSHILTPLYLGIKQIEDEMTGETNASTRG
jgi:Holliday junction resolvase